MHQTLISKLVLSIICYGKDQNSLYHENSNLYTFLYFSNIQLVNSEEDNFEATSLGIRNDT